MRRSRNLSYASCEQLGGVAFQDHPAPGGRLSHDQPPVNVTGHRVPHEQVQIALSSCERLRMLVRAVEDLVRELQQPTALRKPMCFPCHETAARPASR